MKRKFLFIFDTPIGTKIRTTLRYWQLIQIKHPEIIGKLSLIKQVLKMPDLVTVSKIDSTVLLFYRKINGYWLCVVTKNDILDGYMITAYITDKIKEGKKIWGN